MAVRRRAVTNRDIPEGPLVRPDAVKEIPKNIAVPFVIRNFDVRKRTLGRLAARRQFPFGSTEGEDVAPAAAVINPDAVGKNVREAGMLPAVGRNNLHRTSPIELIGQTRQLTYGPYLYLPRGSWRAIFFLAFKNSRSTNFLRADILCNVKEIMGVGDFETIGDGNFTVELPFQVGEPIFPLEARLSLRGGAIEGSLDLLKIEMRRDTSSAAEET